MSKTQRNKSQALRQWMTLLISAGNTQFAPFAEAEKCGVRLMDVLRNKKAPINAYEGLMKWHLVEQGIMANKQGVGEAGPNGRHW